MVRFSEREYAALNRRNAGSSPSIEATKRGSTPMSWECVPCRADGAGLVVHSEAAMRRHLSVHGGGARFECIP